MQFPSMRCAALAAAFSSTLFAQAPCFETNYGTNLQLGDDQVAPNNLLGFSFPGPGGAVTSIDISSNGFVWLGSNPTNNGCCNGDLQLFLSDPPRIAPLWMDIDPGTAGGVWFNTFPATSSTLARAVVTWDQVPEYGTNGVPAFTFQLQLVSDGSFTFLYDDFVSNQWHDVLTGCTQGNNAAPNPVDFTAITSTAPHIGTTPTVHEVQSMVCDLAGHSWQFLPISPGYVVIDRPGCALASSKRFGRGCPSPAVAYELFPFGGTIDLSNTAIDFLRNGSGGYVAIPTTGFFTGHTNALAMGDDVVVGPLNMPFSFPFPGGSTNAIDISSNGFVWLSTGNWNARCCSGNVSDFLADPASIAVLWEDLNPSQGGTVYFDVDPSNTEVHITWLNVPEYYNTGACTAQITLRNDGSFRLSWQSVANLNNDCLVGISQGNGALDPGPIDFSASLPFSVGAGGTPLSLSAQPGARPVLGTSFGMEVTDFPANSAFAFLVVGLNRVFPPIDLSAYGMPGCDQNVTLDATLFFALNGNPAPVAFAVPNNPAFTGFLLDAQVVTLSPGANPLGALTSNGLEMKFGF